MLSSNLIIKELKEQRVILVIGLAIMTALGLFSAWSYTMVDSLGNMIDFLGPELLAEIEFLQSDYNIYLWSQWHPKNLLQGGTILAIILAATTLAGEFGRGTVTYLTSLPISRSKLLASKAVAGAINLILIIWIPTLLMLAYGHLAEPNTVIWGQFMGATALSTLGLLAIYSISLVFSVIGNDSIKTAALAAGALILWSATNFTSTTRVVSPFWHMRGTNWFFGLESFPWVSVLVLAGLVVVSYLLANRLFSQREI